jgi:ribosomal protein S18 acetylase RimI-like enzyme
VDDSPLPRLERYYDAVPRATARTEEHGPLTLFVADRGWPFYARPRLGLLDAVRRDEVEAVLARQDELGVPRALEWVHETTPSLAQAALEAGMTVARCPLLVLGRLRPPMAPAAALVRLLDADDPDLAAVRAALHVGFGAAGTAAGPESAPERDAAMAEGDSSLDAIREAVAAGRTVQAGAFDAAVGAVGGGGHNPRGTVSEIVGVGVLPAYRRRGLAAALTALLATDATGRGVTTVFCAAETDDVARVYERIGFRRVGTACIAEKG